MLRLCVHSSRGVYNVGTQDSDIGEDLQAVHPAEQRQHRSILRPRTVAVAALSCLVSISAAAGHRLGALKYWYTSMQGFARRAVAPGKLENFC